MREAVFLRNNEQKWLKIEQHLSRGSFDSVDELIFYYQDLSADLSYARSNYPSSKSVLYLNQLCQRLYTRLGAKESRWKSKFIDFWRYDLPKLFYLSRKELLISFVFFFICCIIGAVSTHYEPSFANIVLSEGYVNQTIENIQKGDPTAIYKSQKDSLMFMTITLNNIKVSLITFLAGFFFGIGSYCILFSNGIMLGTFQYFFYTKGVLVVSALSIWIHGTIEISSIIIAGASGIVVGNGFLFPGRNTRIKSLAVSGKRGVTMALGLIPMFIIAGFLESFVTRHSHWHPMLKLSIIILSLIFVLYYFVVYPHLLYHQKLNDIEKYEVA